MPWRPILSRFWRLISQGLRESPSVVGLSQTRTLTNPSVNIAHSLDCKGAPAGLMTGAATLPGAMMKFSIIGKAGVAFSGIAFVALLLAMLSRSFPLDVILVSLAFGVLGVSAFAAEIASRLPRSES